MSTPVEVKKWEPPEIGGDSTGLTTKGAPMMRRVDASGAVQVPSPIELIQFAIERGVDGDQLEKLVSLHERMDDRNARRAFFDALRKFQHEVGPVKKNKTAKIPTKGGGSYSFEYAELDEIELHVRPQLDANDLSYSFDSVVDDKGLLLTNVCTLRHALGHAEKSSFTLPTASESAMSAQQRFSAANSFAKRQTLAAVLGLSITNKEVPDDEVDPATITDDQAVIIHDRLADLKVNPERFCKHFGVGRVEDLRAADYENAVTLLAARERELEKKGAR